MNAQSAYCLNLACPPVSRATRVRGSRHGLPVRSIGQTVGSADKVITPGQCEAADGRHGGLSERQQTGCCQECHGLSVEAHFEDEIGNFASEVVKRREQVKLLRRNRGYYRQIVVEKEL